MYIPKISYFVFSIPSLFTSLKTYIATFTMFVPKAIQIDVYVLYTACTKHCGLNS